MASQVHGVTLIDFRKSSSSLRAVHNFPDDHSFPQSCLDTADRYRTMKGCPRDVTAKA